MYDHRVGLYDGHCGILHSYLETLLEAGVLVFSTKIIHSSCQVLPLLVNSLLRAPTPSLRQP